MKLLTWQGWRWALLLTAAALAVGLAGCGGGGGGKPTELVGRWEYLNGATYQKPEDIELFKDGTGVLDKSSITWKVENKRLVMLSALKGMSCDYKVSGYELTLTYDDSTSATFVKKGKSEEVKAERIAEMERSFVLVKGGTFTMGCTPERLDDCPAFELLTQSVTVGDFYIGKYEVTQKLWNQVMEWNPSHFKGDNLPVESVSWSDVQKFIQKLNAATGKTYRLPTEAEWEYAALGGSKSKGYKYSGGNSIGSVAWYVVNSGDKALSEGLLEEHIEKDDIDGYLKAMESNKNRTRAVGTKQPNELGIYDMSGNVWEWVSDWYGAYSLLDQTNPTGPSSGSYRVLRGGSWGHGAGGCRVSFRNFDDPDDRSDYLGFRLALSPK